MSDSELCPVCSAWARVGDFDRDHHESCPLHLKRLIPWAQRLYKGITQWAADEDGVPKEVFLDYQTLRWIAGEGANNTFTPMHLLLFKEKLQSEGTMSAAVPLSAPWVAKCVNRDDFRDVVRDANNCDVCEVSPRIRSVEADNHARLIAASPVLLRACLAVESSSQGVTPEILKSVQDAIKLATG